MYVIWLHEIKEDDSYLVGNKAANLGKLIKYGFNVPTGFCIMRKAHEEFLYELDIEESLFSNIISMETEQNIIDSMMRFSLPSRIKKEIIDAYKILCGNDPLNNYTAIRSSAIDEDSNLVSHAGQYETFLNIGSISDVIYYIKKCWTSNLFKKICSYKDSKKLNIHKISMGVIVQKIIPSEISGVLFTIHPVSFNHDQMVIEANWGLCETVVSGRVEPDRYIIQKKDLAIQDITIGKKTIMSIVNSNRKGIKIVKMPKELHMKTTLTNEDILKLAKIGIEIESYFGSPQDIEWGIRNDCIYILQARPIFLPDILKEVPDSHIWTDEKINERFPDPLMPLDATFLKYWFFEPTLTYLLKSFGVKNVSNSEICRIYKGKLYLNKRLISQICRETSIVESILSGKFKNSVNILRIPKSFFLRLIYLIIITYWKSISSIHRFNKTFRKIKTKNYLALPWNQLSKEMAKLYKVLFSISKQHMVSIVLAEIVYFMVEKIVTQYLGEENRHLAKKLITGVRNKTIEMNQEFLLLIEHINKNKEIKNSFQDEPISTLLPKLMTMKEGQKFINNLQIFLDKFGHRSEKYEISFPRWKEQPNIILERLKDCIDLERGSSLLAEQGMKKEDAKILNMLRNNLRKKKGNKLLLVQLILFSIILKYARRYGGFLREEEGYYITMLFPEIKRYYIAIGNKLVMERKMHNAEDIFFLELSEIEKIINNDISLCENLEYLVEERKREYDLNRNFFKEHQQKHKDYVKENVFLEGIPVSPGIYSGYARVIFTHGERIKDGEILVTRTLNPSWAILFHRVKAVITEVGGILSHSAILAREFGIPAVSGIENATKIIKNGQFLTVNGDNGSICYNKE